MQFAVGIQDLSVLETAIKKWGCSGADKDSPGPIKFVNKEIIGNNGRLTRGGRASRNGNATSAKRKPGPTLKTQGRRKQEY